MTLGHTRIRSWNLSRSSFQKLHGAGHTHALNIQSGQENSRKSWGMWLFFPGKIKTPTKKKSGYLRCSPWVSSAKDCKSSCIPNIQQDDWSSQLVQRCWYKVITHYSLHWKSGQWKFETEVLVIAGFKPSEFWRIETHDRYDINLEI